MKKAELSEAESRKWNQFYTRTAQENGILIINYIGPMDLLLCTKTVIKYGILMVKFIGLTDLLLCSATDAHHGTFSENTILRKTLELN